MIGDIEIVCLPKRIKIESIGDFFSDGQEAEISTSGFTKCIYSLGNIIKGQASGKYIQIESKLFETQLDIFMPDDFDYYRQLAIRTGSADYSHMVIASGWRNIGWCGSDKGLRKISDCEKTKSGWRCINENSERAPFWQSEKDFFDWIKVPYVEPKYRFVK